MGEKRKTLIIWFFYAEASSSDRLIKVPDTLLPGKQ